MKNVNPSISSHEFSLAHPPDAPPGTHLSHLSLLFLHGSQLIALRARLGGGGRLGSRWLSDGADAPGPVWAAAAAAGERARDCFVRGGAVMG